MRSKDYRNTQLGIHVETWYDGDWNINFTIEGVYDKIDRNNKVAVSKALLAIWKEIKIDLAGKELWCSPYDRDGNAEYRFNLFSKLGFVKEGKYTMTCQL